MKAKPKILVVEDDFTTRTLLERTLEVEGYEVSTAADGSQVPAHLQESLPALVILDLMMPGVDGFAVLKQLRANETTHELPVLILTALDDPSSTWKGWSGGCDYYITKPFDTEALLFIIRNLTAGAAA
jgi:DNA-binding response OmpR family regulator